MKIKDLPEDIDLYGIKVRVPSEIECEIHEGYWKSQWGYSDGKAGVWLQKEIRDSRIYPVCIDNLLQCLEWEIID